jgi:hypothetical protein
MSIRLGAQTFAGWTAARKYLLGIVPRIADGERISGDFASVLRDALQHHPEADDKIGPGLSHFTAGPHATYPRTRCIYLCRTDGTKVAVSFKNIGAAAETRSRRDRLRAMRRAVEPQIVGLLIDAFGNSDTIACPISGVAISRYDCEVDHAAPATFAHLAGAWLESAGLELGDLRIFPPPHPHCELSDPHQLQAWQQYHRQNAELRIISKDAHRSLTAPPRSAP